MQIALNIQIENLFVFLQGFLQKLFCKIIYFLKIQVIKLIVSLTLLSEPH